MRSNFDLVVESHFRDLLPCNANLIVLPGRSQPWVVSLPPFYYAIGWLLLGLEGQNAAIVKTSTGFLSRKRIMWTGPRDSLDLLTGRLGARAVVSSNGGCVVHFAPGHRKAAAIDAFGLT